MSKGQKAPASIVKHGAMIERRRNRTVNQDVAHSIPKWAPIGGGVLEYVGPGADGAHRHRIYLRDGKWTSYPRPSHIAAGYEPVYVAVETVATPVSYSASVPQASAFGYLPEPPGLTAQDIGD